MRNKTLSQVGAAFTIGDQANARKSSVARIVVIDVRNASDLGEITMDDGLRDKIYDHLRNLNFTDLYDIICMIADINYEVVSQVIGLDEDWDD